MTKYKHDSDRSTKEGTATRRGFLKSGVATATAFGLPTIVPGMVFGANAPSNRVTVGLLGCGALAGYYHSTLLGEMEDVRVVAACDAFKSRREHRAAAFNQLYGGSDVCTPHADFRDVLARSDVDAVVIATHDNWHTPMSIAAVRAGKDVYCQKPLALDLTRTKLLRRVVNRYGPVFQFGTQYRSMEKYRKMIELIRNGYIGQLKRIDVWSQTLHATYAVKQYRVKPYGSTKQVPVPKDLDFDAWQGPSPMVPYTVDRCTRWGGFHCPETSLGFIAGCGVHPLGIAQWGNNTDHTSPIRYEGTGSIPTEGIFRTLDRWDVACDYENGVKMRFMDFSTAKPVVSKYGYWPWMDMDGLLFHGTDGWFAAQEVNGFFASDERLWDVNLKPDEERLPVGIEHNRNFIDCVKSRQEPLCPVEMAIRCDTICHLARTAALIGRVIHWDPEKEEIVGDRIAAGMLSLPYRDKWKVW